MTTGRWSRWGWLALTAVLAAVFAYLNSGEHAALNLGFTVLYQVPVVALVFVAFLLGMVAMFLIGLRHDRRVRRLLRESGFAEQASRRADPDPPPGGAVV